MTLKDFINEYVESLFNQLGITIPIEEKLMDAATVLGACGIAYAACAGSDRVYNNEA
jgi:pyrroline-5-carboxylate reductase